MRFLGRFLGLVLGLVLAVGGVAFAQQADVTKLLPQLKLPAGFKISVFAKVPNARSMAVSSPLGVVFVGTRYDTVYAVVDRDKDGVADEVIRFATGLKVPNGVDFKNGFLYVAEQHRILRYAAAEFDLYKPFPPDVIFDKLPDKPLHGWRYIRIGPDGKLYVAVGVPCNICDPEGYEGTVLRMNLDGSNPEVFLSGIRNIVGFDWHPKTGVFYATNNGADGMGDDVPPDTLIRADRPGLYFGFPYVATAGGKIPSPGYEGKTPPMPITPAVMEFQAHSAPLGIHFYRGKAFPEPYRSGAFVARHGSWNRSTPVGYDVLFLQFDAKGNPVKQQPFITGWLSGNGAWGRPVDIKELPDGSLLISDDFAGVIYRVTYTGKR
jgi:glucose/arabinose dehydrogenase